MFFMFKAHVVRVESTGLRDFCRSFADNLEVQRKLSADLASVLICRSAFRGFCSKQHLPFSI